MKTKHLQLPLLGAALLLLATSGLAGEHRFGRDTAMVTNLEILVPKAPPAPRDEWITECPGPNYAWIPGAWVWHGHWFWVAGRWAHPPYPNLVWMPHRYLYRDGMNYYVRGGWSY